MGRWGFLVLMVLLWSGLLWRVLGPLLHIAVNLYYALVTAAVSAF